MADGQTLRELEAGWVAKFSPDQPRVPAGDPAGGQWTSWSSAGLPGGPNFEEIAKQAVAEVLKDHPRYKPENIETNGINAAMRDAANHTDWHDWYDRHRGLIEELYGKENAAMFQKFLAAGSINQGVGGNVGESIRAMNHYLAGGSFDKGSFSTLPARRAQYAAIAAGGDPTGRKIEPFYRALAGDPEAVPMDRWMKRIIFKNPIEEGPSDAQTVTGQAVVRAVAHHAGMSPRDLQAVLWTAKLAEREAWSSPTDYRKELLARRDKIDGFFAQSGLARKAVLDHFPPLDGRPLSIHEQANAYHNAAILMTAIDLMHKALGTDAPTPEQVTALLGKVEKFNPDQPRVPAGNPDGGQWTSGMGGAGVSVLFEVAPNPDDKELTARWDSLTDEQKQEITHDIVQEITPKVLEHYGVDGKLIDTIGGFEGHVNPGLDLQLSSAGKEHLIASALGEGLSQKSMVIASATKMEGLDRVSGAAIHVPAGERSAAGVKAIFDKAATVPGVDGFTYRNNQIEILNFTGIDSKTFAHQINDSLGDAYRVKHAQIYSTLLEADSYASGTGNARGVSGQSFGSSIRSAVQASLDARLRKFGKRFDPAAEGWDYPLEILKFDPSQPRVPAGSPDGGQWTDGSAGAAPEYGDNELLNPEPSPEEQPFNYKHPPAEYEGVPVRVGDTPEKTWMAAYRMYGDGKDEVVINPEFLKDGNAGLNQQIAMAHASGWLSSNHPNHVIWHEMGHAGLNRTRGYIQTTAALDVREFHPKFPEFGEVASRVSGQATVNGSEFLAEYYAGRRSGKVYDWEVNGLAKKIMGFTADEQADFLDRQRRYNEEHKL